MPLVSPLAYQKQLLNTLGGEIPPLAIVGNHSSVQKHKVFESDAAIWVMNGKGCTLPRYDLVFQMHQPCDWGGGWANRWLRDNTTVPVYMRNQYPDVPMAVPYPFARVFGMLEKVKHHARRLRFHTGTPSYAVALAILQGYKKIEMLGVEMNEREYTEQQASFAFWVGFAGGRGIELEINCASNIFDKPLYGEKPLQE